MQPQTHILIVGTGFGGLAMAIRLKQAGITSFTLLEKADGVGGTWRDNHYPGAACDVPSHLYSFSFAPKPDWSRAFASQHEILAYLEGCVDRFGLRPHIRFGAEVRRADFDERRSRWEVEVASGGAVETLSARFLVAATGGLSRPAYPDIPGLSEFRGDVLHSARWREEVALDGRRVAVIGTGASAIQIVPQLVPRVARLHLFQRTAPWVMPRRDRAFTRREKWVFRTVPGARWLVRQRLYWGHEAKGLGFVRFPAALRVASRMARKHLARQVSDPDLRARLTPDIAMGCKRVLLADDYYPAVADDRVELITEGIDRIEADAVVTSDGRRREVDALVLCTGFKAAEDMAPFPVCGVGGRDLADEWRRGGEAYLGTAVAGYPNLFVVIGPNTGLGHSSMVFIIESQVSYILDAIRQADARGLARIDLKRSVQDAFNRRLQDRMRRTIWVTGGCRSWYLTADGRNTTLWPGLTVEFYLRTRRADLSCYEQVPLNVSEGGEPTMVASAG